MKVHLFLAAALLASGSSIVDAQTSPSSSVLTRPIRLIVPYPPGGGADEITRITGNYLSRKFGQTVTVENRPGAAGSIGATACKNAAPDGTTFCMFLSDILALNPYTYTRLPYDADKDFVPVAGVINVDVMVMASSQTTGADLRETLQWTRGNPGKLNWGSVGVGSSAHLVLENINRAGGVAITHVPYQGAGPVLNALMTNEIQMGMVGYAQGVQYANTGRLKALAVLGPTRFAQYPQVPTLAEQGVDFTATVWLSLFAPAKTPPEIVTAVNQAVNEMLRDEVLIRDKLLPSGYSPIPGTPQALADRVKRDQEAWGGFAKRLGIRLE